tara:strand:- start:193 stop:360 length:168 start_codon:yes stop_codon:yes gene_type:complete
MSREFVDATMNGDNSKAEDDFKTSIAAKVGEVLELKRRELAKSFVGTHEKAENDA